jgi:hypothetical protein
MNTPIRDYNSTDATPFAYGNSHIQPTNAIDPGLRLSQYLPSSVASQTSRRCRILIKLVRFSSLLDLNSLTNRILNKNIKIIFLYIKNNKK